MKKSNIPANTFRFMMPTEYDFGGQIRDGKGVYKNMGFDEMKLVTDPETNVSLIDMVKFCNRDKNPLAFFWESLVQSNNVRKWLRHLFAKDFESFGQRKPDVYWRYMLYLDGEESEFLDQYSNGFNEKFTGDRHGPHIAIERRGKILVVRLKEGSYEDLYARFRQKIQLALQPVGGE